MSRISSSLETTVGPNDTEVNVAYTFERPPRAVGSLVYVHGWGCSQRDFEGAAIDPVLSKYRRLTFDFPGHGESLHPSGEIAINDIVTILDELIDSVNIGYFTLIGHSLGGLAALKYALKRPDKVAGLVNIVGNLKSEDCFLTQDFVEGRKTRTSMIDNYRDSQNPGFRRYAESLQRASERTMGSLAASAVASCAENKPYEEFIGFKRPKLFVCGSEAVDSLPYLADLRAIADTYLDDHEAEDGPRTPILSELEVVEIPRADHFPAVDNPIALYTAIGNFVQSIDDRL